MVWKMDIQELQSAAIGRAVALCQGGQGDEELRPAAELAVLRCPGEVAHGGECRDITRRLMQCGTKPGKILKGIRRGAIARRALGRQGSNGKERANPE